MPWPRGLIKYWGAIPVALVIALFCLRAAIHIDPMDQLAVATPQPADPAGAIVRTGSLAVMRGGPVIIGFVSEREARLSIGGRDVRGKSAVRDGVRAPVTDRIVLPAGPHAIRFAGPSDARLVWSPVGRRGDPEYLSASSLSPEPPERASFEAPGTERSDGAIGLALLAVVVGTLLVLARRRLAVVPRCTWIAMAAVFAVAIAVRLIDLGGAGQTFDEDVNWASGRNYLGNLLGLQLAGVDWSANFEHPPVMKLLAGIGAQLSDGLGPARALSALWVALGCALLVPIGERLYRRRIGILGGGIAALLPALVAHGQIVGHESITVLWWALGVLLALGVHDHLPEDERAIRRVVAIRLGWLGIVIGLAIASRFINGLLGVLCITTVIATAPAQWRRTTLVIAAGLLPAVAILAFYSVWPRLWPHPVAAIVGPIGIIAAVAAAATARRGGAALTALVGGVAAVCAVLALVFAAGPLSVSLAKLSVPHAPEPFLGTITNKPGPHYFVVYLVATLPLGVVLGVLAWFVRIPIEGKGAECAMPEPGQPPPPCRPCRAAIVLGTWLVVPLAVLASPVRQDGVRYVMPCLLALSLISAAGFDFVVLAVERRLRQLFIAVATAMAAYLGFALWQIHPYYLDYFGEQVGGTSAVAAAKRFETAWWGEGLDRAIDYVNTHAAPNSRVYRACIHPVEHLGWFREDLWAPMTQKDNEAEWIVQYAPNTRYCKLTPGAQKVFEVVADGAVLAIVYRR
ncbi:MAG: ArnT family glycosyltransferase [Kofleriaceae bacterium]